MSAYNIDGVEIFSANQLDGYQLQQAYDINGHPLFQSEPPTPPEPTKQPLTVMSYNVQWFTGINSQTDMQQQIISTYNPSVIGLQELTTSGTIPTVGQNVLSGYTYKQLSNHKNYLGVASKLALYDTTIADFNAQDPDDMTQYNETRAYIKTYFDFNGNKICLINTHLALANSYIYSQFNEIFNIAEQEDYVIITGDFNTAFTAFTDDIYINTFKKFVDAGYNIANNSPDVGITNTYSGRTDATELSDLRTNPDSIIVSGNISIDSVVFDTIKLNHLNGNAIDHIAVVANLLI